MTIGLFFATLAAAMIYVLTPGPAFLALFALAAKDGRVSGTWFVAGHLVGDVLWGTLALAAIVGVNQLGPLLFEILGLLCGAYLIFLGVKAILAKEASGSAVIGGRHPLVAGLLFGVTNPKAYPVSVAMFTVLVGHYAGLLTWDMAPLVMAVAFLGFVLADVILVAVAGLSPVRRFFLTHGLIVTRLVGLTFVLFGAKSIADAVQSYRARA
ncbi:LysE family translocator [Phreatobacter oligotrophus]|jgi:threonine/homoserine/homoserine lactone efflux protein|uniref:Threonine/homoserine/homoserine lactone efflux protein n=1 Tax=Phreatobacter oligotrophus TaxID=1122261 RepID=A0A2T4ZHP9_9HYPH|nr:LysE family translocator [Phreatobacter oligotrophus]MBX9991564.1 LysE family translocator [Phreatobacter oligotrophus]PTM61520.1 threonine/homoserine/homoserine lactone efflux protein [Phreatobacter oligotrophus]